MTEATHREGSFLTRTCGYCGLEHPAFIGCAWLPTPRLARGTASYTSDWMTSLPAKFEGAIFDNLEKLYEE